MNFEQFLSGVAMASFAGSGLFFLKFWRSSKDKFFLYFSIGFWLLSFDRILLLVKGALHPAPSAQIPESVAMMYLIRLLAYVVLIYAIVERNRKSS
jgi:hypothetical protein